MIEHKLGNSIPSRVVRFGVRHHGLVLTHAIKDPVYTQYQFALNGVKIVTRAGKTIPYPLIPEKVGTSRGFQLSSKLGPSCMYMHPNAAMDTEDADGNDWSGYVVFSLKDDYSGGRILGYSETSLFAYTPSHNGLGFLVTNIRATAFTIKAKPLMVGERNLETESYSITGVVGEPIFASKTGRELYFAELPTPLKIINEIDYPDWDTTGKPRVKKVSISDTFDGNDNISLSFSYQSIPVTVSDESTVDSYETRKYKALKVTVPQVGTCADPEYAVATVDEHSNLNAPMNGYANAQTLIDTYSLIRKKSVIAASIGDHGGADFLSFLFEEYKKLDGGGNITGSGTVATGGACGEIPGQIKITGTTTTVSSSFSSAGVDRTRAALEGYGGSSTVELRLDTTSSSSYSKYTVDGTDPVITETMEETDTFTIELDGTVLFSGSGYKGGVIDPIYEKPPLPTFYMTAPQGLFFGTRLEEYGERQTGTKFLIVSARVCDYGSRDLRSLMVVLETGTLIKQGDIFVVNQSSYKAEIFIGKTFGRGVIDGYTHSEVITGLTDYFLCRAYDPVEKKISPVYPYPVFYQ